MRTNELPTLSLFPLTAGLSEEGHLSIAGCDVVDLAREYGTPLYIFDEFTLRHNCREFAAEFTKRYPDTLIVYASKAFLNGALALILQEEGLGLDVVSGGELTIALSVDFPADRIYFHGNNKTLEELTLALDHGIGRVVVDNSYELELLDGLCRARRARQDVLLRITPGVDPHTHRYTTTGTLDSKFGFPLATGQAEEAVKQALSSSQLNLLGLHFHLGSPVPETRPFEMAMELALRFAEQMKQKLGFHVAEFGIGGGFAVRYTMDSEIPAVSDYAQVITGKLNSLVTQAGLDCPRLIVEPGRAIVGQAGIALYTVGAVKEIPGVRKYVCVDGGMSDNIRPSLYEARYEMLLANRPLEPQAGRVTVAGKLCESGDILARDINLPSVSPGDLMAVPVCGAYCIPLSSNYNALPKPAIVVTRDGEARLVRRRESYQDLMRLDVA